MALLDLMQLFARQHGTVSRDQAVELGASAWLIRRELSAGRWEVLAPSVYGLCGHRPSWHRALWVAHLHAGPESVVSHESAARLLGFSQLPVGRVVLSVPGRRRHAPSGVRWRRVQDLEPGDVQKMNGLPVTSGARTVVDLAAVCSNVRLRVVAEQALLERRCSVAELGCLLDRLRRRGKPGVQRMERVLDATGPGSDVPRSELERLVDHVIHVAGLPVPIREHPLPSSRGRSGFVDRCWPDLKWIVEADGRRWHARHQQMVADADRTMESQALGFDTTRVLWEHASGDVDGTADRLHQVYEQRRIVAAALGRTDDV